MRLFGGGGKLAKTGPEQAAARSGPINVQELIAGSSNAEHAARADAYFSAIPNGSLLLRKPFFGLQDTPANLYGVSEMLNGLQLFPGARVLDFGAGTGWLSRILCFLDCRPIACDVSAAALAMGRQAFERDPLAQGLAIDWLPYDGITIPCEDASVDRIVCYDAFHHVADQAATLREFFRVLRNGGTAAFHEPGPNHSQAPVSQYEMRRHGVIENDIIVEDIWRAAQPVGFTGLQLAAATPVAARLDIDAYRRVAAGQQTPEDTDRLLDAVRGAAVYVRIFFLAKGEEIRDSRHGVGLGGTFELAVTETTGSVLKGHARATNTGAVRWRASVPEAGGVWIGVKDPNATGGQDYGRIHLSDGGVAPGESVSVSFTLPAPPSRPMDLLFDLVAEQVAWFEPFGTVPVVIRIG